MSSSRVGSAVSGAVSSFLGLATKPGLTPKPDKPLADKPLTDSLRQPPPALPRTPAEAAASPPVSSANPVKTADAAAAVENTGPVPGSIPGSVPYRKGAGEWVPPGTANGPIVVGDNQPQVSEIPVKAHVRHVPAVPQEEKSLLPAAITIEMLVSEFRRAQRITTQRVLLLGACVSTGSLSS